MITARLSARFASTLRVPIASICTMLSSPIMPAFFNCFLDMTGLAQKLTLSQFFFKSLTTNCVHPREWHRFFRSVYVIDLEILHSPTSAAHPSKTLYGLLLPPLVTLSEIFSHLLRITVCHPSMVLQTRVMSILHYQAGQVGIGPTSLR